MNTLLSHPSVSTTEISSSDAIVATPPQPVRANANASLGRLAFTKFLEDQRFIQLLPERSLLDSSGRRAATTVPAEPTTTPSATILGRIATTLASVVGASTRAVQQFCKAPVLPYAQLWEADFLVAQLTGTQTSRREKVSAGDTFAVDDTRLSDRWLRS
jgi:hypothetical protein